MTGSYLSTGAAERAMHGMTTGGVLALDRRRQLAGYDQLQELESQFQIPIWGLASSGIGWNKFSVLFDVQYAFASNQRDSPLTFPHFSYGTVISGVPDPNPLAPDVNNPDSLCAVFCQVIDWGRDIALSVITGAQVGIGVSTVGGADVRFEGYVHLTFTGYGTVNENPPNLSVGG